MNIEFLSPENVEYWVSEHGECEYYHSQRQRTTEYEFYGQKTPLLSVRQRLRQRGFDTARMQSTHPPLVYIIPGDATIHGRDLEPQSTPAYFGTSLVDALLSASASTVRCIPRRAGGVYLLHSDTKVLGDIAGLMELPFATASSRFVPWCDQQLDPTAKFARDNASFEEGANPVRLACVVIGQARDGSVLLTRRCNRRRGTYNRLWVFPGGHVDAGEQLEQAAARELLEETGLQCSETSLRPVGIWQAQVIKQKRQFCMMVCAAHLDLHPDLSTG